MDWMKQKALGAFEAAVEPVVCRANAIQETFQLNSHLHTVSSATANIFVNETEEQKKPQVWTFYSPQINFRHLFTHSSTSHSGLVEQETHASGTLELFQQEEYLKRFVEAFKGYVVASPNLAETLPKIAQLIRDLFAHDIDPFKYTILEKLFRQIGTHMFLQTIFGSAVFNSELGIQPTSQNSMTEIGMTGPRPLSELLLTAYSTENLQIQQAIWRYVYSSDVISVLNLFIVVKKCTFEAVQVLKSSIKSPDSSTLKLVKQIDQVLLELNTPLSELSADPSNTNQRVAFELHQLSILYKHLSKKQRTTPEVTNCVNLISFLYKSRLMNLRLRSQTPISVEEATRIFNGILEDKRNSSHFQNKKAHTWLQWCFMKGSIVLNASLSLEEIPFAIEALTELNLQLKFETVSMSNVGGFLENTSLCSSPEDVKPSFDSLSTELQDLYSLSILLETNFKTDLHPEPAPVTTDEASFDFLSPAFGSAIFSLDPVNESQSSYVPSDDSYTSTNDTPLNVQTFIESHTGEDFLTCLISLENNDDVASWMINASPESLKLALTPNLPSYNAVPNTLEPVNSTLCFAVFCYLLSNSEEPSRLAESLNKHTSDHLLPHLAIAIIFCEISKEHSNQSTAYLRCSMGRVPEELVPFALINSSLPTKDDQDKNLLSPSKRSKRSPEVTSTSAKYTGLLQNRQSLAVLEGISLFKCSKQIKQRHPDLCQYLC